MGVPVVRSMRQFVNLRGQRVFFRVRLVFGEQRQVRGEQQPGEAAEGEMEQITERLHGEFSREKGLADSF